MRLAAMLLVLACCAAGCGGTVVLHSRTEAPAPPAAPVPCHDCQRVSRDEAVEIVHRAARHHEIVRLRIDDVERKKHDWRIEGRGLDTCGHRVDVQARVDRRSGAVEKFQVRSDEHRKHHKHRTRRDDD
jgi:hypothetical protein